MTKFATIAWALWQRQNSFRVTHDRELPNIVFRRTTDFLQEYQEANARSLSSSTHPIIQVRWSPPPYDMFKINFDGAMFVKQNSAGIGIIIRNHHGTPVATVSKKIVEARAAKEVIKLALHLHMDRVIFEGDSSILISALQATNQCLTPYGLIIDDAKVLTSSFACSFAHIKHQGNSVAHILARKVKDLSVVN
jgi:ribonuclease HI